MICSHSFYLICVGSWTHTASIVSQISGSKEFSNGGVTVYGSTVAVVGGKDDNEVEIHSDTGTYSATVSVSDPKGVSMYGNVLAVQNDASIFIFEKITGSWTQTASHTSNAYKNVQMYSNFVVGGSTGEYHGCSVHTHIMCTS